MRCAPRLLVLVLVAMALPGVPSRAQTPAAPTPASPAVVEMAAIFEAFCLKAFPDDSAVSQLTKSPGYQALSSQAVAIYLHADPGHGWRFRTTIATYVLTIEDPPYRTCALRRMTGDGFPTAVPFVDAVRRHAALRGQVMQAIPAQQSRFRAVATCSRPGSQGSRPAAKSQPMCICCCTRITMATTLAKWPPMIPRERWASRSVTRIIPTGPTIDSLRHGRACHGHPRIRCGRKTWVPGPSPGMTEWDGSIVWPVGITGEIAGGAEEHDCVRRSGLWH
jgi:hypothetical protein